MAKKVKMINQFVIAEYNKKEIEEKGYSFGVFFKDDLESGFAFATSDMDTETLEQAIEFAENYDEPKTKKITPIEIEKLILKRELELTAVIDAVIKINGYVGVGCITLGDNLKSYCYSKGQNKISYEKFMSE